MTADDYRKALKALGIRSHDVAAQKLGITARTSYRYAKSGAPLRVDRTIDAMLSAQRQAGGTQRPAAVNNG